MKRFGPVTMVAGRSIVTIDFTVWILNEKVQAGHTTERTLEIYYGGPVRLVFEADQHPDEIAEIWH